MKYIFKTKNHQIFVYQQEDKIICVGCPGMHPLVNLYSWITLKYVGKVGCKFITLQL